MGSGSMFNDAEAVIETVPLVDVISLCEFKDFTAIVTSVSARAPCISTFAVGATKEKE